MLWGDVCLKGFHSVNDLCFDPVVILSSDASSKHYTWGVAMDCPFHFVGSKVIFLLGVEVHAGFLGPQWFGYVGVGLVCYRMW